MHLIVLVLFADRAICPYNYSMADNSSSSSSSSSTAPAEPDMVVRVKLSDGSLTTHVISADMRAYKQIRSILESANPNPTTHLEWVKRYLKTHDDPAYEMKYVKYMHPAMTTGENPHLAWRSCWIIPTRNGDGHTFNKSDFAQKPDTVPDTLRTQTRWTSVEDAIRGGLGKTGLASLPDLGFEAKALINMFASSNIHDLAVIYVVFVPDVLHDGEWAVYVGETDRLSGRWSSSYATTSYASHTVAITNVIRQPDAKMDKRVAADEAMAAAALNGQHSLLFIVETVTAVDQLKPRQEYWIGKLDATGPRGLNVRKK